MLHPHVLALCPESMYLNFIVGFRVTTFARGAGLALSAVTTSCGDFAPRHGSARQLPFAAIIGARMPPKPKALSGWIRRIQRSAYQKIAPYGSQSFARTTVRVGHF